MADSMVGRHPDAHWDCKTCGAPLVRGDIGQGTSRTIYVYSSAISGDTICRVNDGRQVVIDQGGSVARHQPAPVPVDDPEALERWLG